MLFKQFAIVSFIFIRSSLLNDTATDKLNNMLDPQTQTSFKATLSLDQKAYKKGQSIKVSMVVENISDQKATFCDYHTPFEGVKNNIFSVFRMDQEVPYQGIMKKRTPPSKKNYKLIASGQSMSCSALLEGYTLDKKGNYTIWFTGNMISGLPVSNKVSFSVL